MVVNRVDRTAFYFGKSYIFTAELVKIHIKRECVLSGFEIEIRSVADVIVCRIAFDDILIGNIIAVIERVHVRKRQTKIFIIIYNFISYENMSV